LTVLIYCKVTLQATVKIFISLKMTEAFQESGLFQAKQWIADELQITEQSVRRINLVQRQAIVF